MYVCAGTPYISRDFILLMQSQAQKGYLIIVVVSFPYVILARGDKYLDILGWGGRYALGFDD